MAKKVVNKPSVKRGRKPAPATLENVILRKMLMETLRKKKFSFAELSHSIYAFACRNELPLKQVADVFESLIRDISIAECDPALIAHRHDPENRYFDEKFNFIEDDNRGHDHHDHGNHHGHRGHGHHHGH